MQFSTLSCALCDDDDDDGEKVRKMNNLLDILRDPYHCFIMSSEKLNIKLRGTNLVWENKNVKLFFVVFKKKIFSSPILFQIREGKI